MEECPGRGLAGAAGERRGGEAGCVRAHGKDGKDGKELALSTAKGLGAVERWTGRGCRRNRATHYHNGAEHRRATDSPLYVL